jgi:hypothetical protein
MYLLAFFQMSAYGSNKLAAIHWKAGSCESCLPQNEYNQSLALFGLFARPIMVIVKPIQIRWVLA